MAKLNIAQQFLDAGRNVRRLEPKDYLERTAGRTAGNASPGVGAKVDGSLVEARCFVE